MKGTMLESTSIGSIAREKPSKRLLCYFDADGIVGREGSRAQG